MTTITRDEAIHQLGRAQLAAASEQQRRDLLMDYWTIRPEDPDFSNLPSELQEELKNSPAPDDASDARYDPLIRLALRDRWRGVRNEYLATALGRLGLAHRVVGNVEPLHACPCCGNRTLPCRRQLDICRVCLW